MTLCQVRPGSAGLCTRFCSKGFTDVSLARLAGHCVADVAKAVEAAEQSERIVGHVRVLSWNVDGWRSKFGKPDKAKDMQAVLAAEQADVVCFQETKIQDVHVPEVREALKKMGYPNSWFATSGPPARRGYSGVAVATKAGLKPLSVTIGIGECDAEGRAITIELPGCFIVNTYVPNSGMKLARLDYRVQSWDVAMKAYLHGLQQRKPVVWLGDLNVANHDMDIYTPSTKADKSPGFTYRERDSFKESLASLEMVDAWRHAHPKLRQYTFFTSFGNSRARNNGWRLDYTVVSRSLMPSVVDTFVRGHAPHSDHVPIGIVLKDVLQDRTHATLPAAATGTTVAAAAASSPTAEA